MASIYEIVKFTAAITPGESADSDMTINKSGICISGVTSDSVGVTANAPVVFAATTATVGTVAGTVSIAGYTLSNSVGAFVLGIASVSVGSTTTYKAYSTKGVV